MLRTYEFYKQYYSIEKEEVDCIRETIEQFEEGKVNPRALRRLKFNGLVYCLAEGKIDTLIKLISPIGIEKKDGSVEYKYYMDAISLDLLRYVENLPSSIMERYAKLMEKEAEEHPEYFHIDPTRLPTERELSERAAIRDLLVKKAAKDIIIVSPRDKERIKSALLDINMGIVGKIKIKDVHARQIPGMGFPIRSSRDVAYYSEVSNYLPSLALFNMNIATTFNDTDGCYDDGLSDECNCRIAISYDTLSEENKCVADAIAESGNGYFSESFLTDGKDLHIVVPCEADETVLDVNKRFIKIISKFTKQDVLHGVLSNEKILKMVGYWLDIIPERDRIRELMKGEITSAKVLEILELCDGLFEYVYDAEEDRFYEDREIYAKHKEFLLETELNNGNGSIAI